ncbi:MAG: hypothetical protein IKO62_04445 [Bacteroidales bacterium]|nr:hypothetical protein [Bacteroidales bacterium]
MTATNNTKAWIITTASVGIVLILAAIFFYNNFFRQTNGPLIETVPPDVAFIFEINDNEQFVKTSASLMPYLTELFALDGLAGYESFLEKMNNREGAILVSGYVIDNKIVPLFSTRMDEHYFKNLLKLLQIDPRNNITFEGYEIYTYGTHYKDFKFVFHNNVFSASEDVELLKKSIVQLKFPKGLAHDKSFKQLYKLVEKNQKQNWLLVNPKNYAEYLKGKMSESYGSIVDEWTDLTSWCAYQVRFSDVEIFLSGYIDTENPAMRQFESAMPDGEFPQRVVPITANNLVVVDDAKPLSLVKYWDVEGMADPYQQNCYQRIAPVQSVYFTLPADTCSYHYCALKIDTTKASFASFFADSLNVDSIQNNTPKSVFSCVLVDFASVFSSLYLGDAYKCMMQVKDYYVLADTSTTLEYYKKTVKSNNYIETGNAFKFASSNTPSDAVWSFTFFNQDGQLKKLMNADVARKSTLNDLKIFSFSHAVPVQNLVGSNIYLKF